jgi:hypothetical protein
MVIVEWDCYGIRDAERALQTVVELLVTHWEAG